MRVLLDSSAWLAHLFGEAGIHEVDRLLSDHRTDIFVCSLSIPEVYARIKALGRQDHWRQVWEAYQPLFHQILAVDELIAHKAIELREASSKRLPTIDSLIAATAHVHHLTLVHRDPHLSSIPQSLLTSLLLPEKLP